MPFWPFKRRETPSVTPAASWEDRLGALERALRESNADLSLLRREWADTLDKLQSWFGREAARKRQQLHRQLEREDSPTQEPAGATNGSAGITKADLRRMAAQKRFGGTQ